MKNRVMNVLACAMALALPVMGINVKSHQELSRQQSGGTDVQPVKAAGSQQDETMCFWNGLAVFYRGGDPGYTPGLSEGVYRIAKFTDGSKTTFEIQGLFCAARNANGCTSAMNYAIPANQGLVISGSVIDNHLLHIPPLGDQVRYRSPSHGANFVQLVDADLAAGKVAKIGTANVEFRMVEDKFGRGNRLDVRFPGLFQLQISRFQFYTAVILTHRHDDQISDDSVCSLDFKWDKGYLTKGNLWNMIGFGSITRYQTYQKVTPYHVVAGTCPDASTFCTGQVFASIPPGVDAPITESEWVEDCKLVFCNAVSLDRQEWKFLGPFKRAKNFAFHFIQNEVIAVNRVNALAILTTPIQFFAQTSAARRRLLLQDASPSCTGKAVSANPHTDPERAAFKQYAQGGKTVCQDARRFKIFGQTTGQNLVGSCGNGMQAARPRSKEEWDSVFDAVRREGALDTAYFVGLSYSYTKAAWTYNKDTPLPADVGPFPKNTLTGTGQSKLPNTDRGTYLCVTCKGSSIATATCSVASCSSASKSVVCESAVLGATAQ